MRQSIQDVGYTARISAVIITCIFCKYGAEKVKLRRRWVHHFPDTGKLVVCEDMTIKPALP